MRKGLLSSVATALVGAGSALGQNTTYLPGNGAPAGQTSGAPVLLSTEPAPPPAAPLHPDLTGGSTGLVPGVDCLPSCVPHQDRFYGEVSYLLGWIKDAPSPGPIAIAAPVGAPLLGPATRTIIGDTSQFDAQNGVRVTVGSWFGCDASWGIEASGFILERTSLNDAALSNGANTNTVNVFRPIFNLNTGVVDTARVGGPGVVGSVAQQQNTRFWGADANFLLNWRNDCQNRTDLIAGFTYYDLEESLRVGSSSSLIPGAARVGSVAFSDSFNTRNQFYGGQLGARTTWTRGPFSLVMTNTLALGDVHESVDRAGSTAILVTGQTPLLSNSGFLVRASNRGGLTDDRFAIALPSNATLNYQVNCHMSAFLGYDFVYLSRVARPGDQTDLFTNVANNGQLVRPSGGIHVDDFWMSALQAGVQFKF
jgi:hypothetical protein